MLCRFGLASHPPSKRFERIEAREMRRFEARAGQTVEHKGQISSHFDILTYFPFLFSFFSPSTLALTFILLALANPASTLPHSLTANTRSNAHSRFTQNKLQTIDPDRIFLDRPNSYTTFNALLLSLPNHLSLSQ
jgi:hypothetical protein